MLSPWSQNTEPRSLEVYLLGLHDYETVLQLQKRLAYDVSGSNGSLGALVLCEHTPTISIGRCGSRSHINCDDDELESRYLPVRWVNRGGGCNLHVPGQLAAYPIIPVQQNSFSLAEYVGLLKKTVEHVLGEFHVNTIPASNDWSIATNSGQIASLGVAVSRWVAYHGIVLNVSGPRDVFRIIRPQGRSTLRATTIQADRCRPISMAAVRESFVRCFARNLNYETYHMYSHHPMLNQLEEKHVAAGHAT